uniref:Uncharacterized protein n=1 Tax=Anguilla anguilla TaxID=7936 RepID=A0A0E9VXP0_ANGAN
MLCTKNTDCEQHKVTPRSSKTK